MQAIVYLLSLSLLLLLLLLHTVYYHTFMRFVQLLLYHSDHYANFIIRTFQHKGPLNKV